MTNNLKEIKANFALFTNEIEKNLEKLNEVTGVQLTFSFEDIDKVHSFYESNFGNPEKLGITIEALNNCFYSFMGEAFKHHLGGYWSLVINKNDKAYGTPVILGWRHKGKGGVAIRPFIWKEYIVRGLMKEPISKMFIVNLVE
jgi:hypothetical protein